MTLPDQPTTLMPPLASLEPRLRPLLPADLYAEAWIDSSPRTLTRVYEHLRTLRRVLYDYVPRQVSENLPHPGESRYEWQSGTLMFTDLSGFTKLMEANASRGRAGAETLRGELNEYFRSMIDVLVRSGGNLLEFTGDAMLVQFQGDQRHNDTAQAIRAGLRMQRAMSSFAHIETAQGTYSLRMRIGLHAGRFFTADIGTPRRMEHVLLGSTVQQTKLAEGAGQVGRVNMTESTYQLVKHQFRFELGKPGYMLVIDDLAPNQLGEYDILQPTTRPASNVLMDRSVESLINEIDQMTTRVEPLACYLPVPIVNLLVESAASRNIQPDCPDATIMFVNLIGLPESVDKATPEEYADVVAAFSRVFAKINAVVEARGGVLKKVTYHVGGSDIVIYFGVPTGHTDDSIRAADAAWRIRQIIIDLKPPTVGGVPVEVTCQIGIARGQVFAAEIGDLRGRREYNVQGDTVNTAARLMDRAVGNQIFMTEPVYRDIAGRFECEVLEPIALKGKATPTPVFAQVGGLKPKS